MPRPVQTAHVQAVPRGQNSVPRRYFVCAAALCQETAYVRNMHDSRLAGRRRPGILERSYSCLLPNWVIPPTSAVEAPTILCRARPCTAATPATPFDRCLNICCPWQWVLGHPQRRPFWTQNLKQKLKDWKKRPSVMTLGLFCLLGVFTHRIVSLTPHR